MHRGGLRQLAAVALALLGDGGKGNRLARAFTNHAAAFEGKLVRRAPKDLRRNGAEALLQLRARLLNGHAGDIRRRRCVGARVVGRGIRIGAEHRDIVHRAFHMLGDHLGQNGVAARPHVGRADDQHVSSIVVQPDGDRPRVNTGDARALHGHAHARGANLAVAHVAHGVFRLPVEHLAATVQAAIERTCVGHLVEIGGHGHALAQHVLLAQPDRVAAQHLGELVHRGFHGELALRRPETTIRARRLHVRVNHVGRELERFQRTRVQGDGLVPGETHRRPTMLAVRARVRQRRHVERADAPIVVRAKANLDFHLVTRRAAGLGLFSREHAHRGAARLQRDERGIHLAHRGLLRAETAADARLLHANAAFRDAQRMGQDAADVEHDLRGRDHMQAPVAIQLGVRAEGLHHGLVEGLRVVGALQDDVAVGEHRLHVTVGVGGRTHEVAPVVAPQIAQHMPVILGVHERGIVLSGAKIQHGVEHVVGHLDARKGCFGGLLALGRHDSHHIAHIAHMTIDNQAVVGACLRVGLSRVAEALPRHVFPGEHINHAGNLLRLRRVDILHDGVGMRAPQKLHHERVGRNVLGEHRLAQKELQRVLLADGLADRLVVGSIHMSSLPRFCW